MKVYIVMEDWEFGDADAGTIHEGTTYIGTVGSIDDVNRLISSDISDTTEGELTVSNVKNDAWAVATNGELTYHFTPYRDKFFVNISHSRRSTRVVIGTLTQYNDVFDTCYESHATYYYYEEDI